MRLKSLCVMLLVILTGKLFSLSYELEFSEADLQFKTSTRNSSYTEVLLKGQDLTTLLGAPQLPEVNLTLIIPRDKEAEAVTCVTTSKELSGTYHILPAQKPLPTSGDIPEFIPEDPFYYQKSENHPKEPARFHREEFLAGNRLVKVKVNPLSYNPVTQKLTLNTRIVVNVNLKTAAHIPEAPKVRFRQDVETYDSYLKAVVANKSDILSYSHQPAVIKTPRSDSDRNYLIVGCGELEPYFKTFIEWKESQGYFVDYIDYDNFTNSPGDYLNTGANGTGIDLGIADKAGSLRTFLHDRAISNGLAYVLLVGDQNHGPLRYGCMFKDSWYEDEDDDIPNYKVSSDIYFAEFHGSWNVDGIDDPNEGIYRYGETGDDDVHTIQDIMVGRVIIPSVAEGAAQEIANWTEKTITYATNPGNGDPSYLKTFFGASTEEIFYTENIHGDYRIDAFLRDNGFTGYVLEEDLNNLQETSGKRTIGRLKNKGITFLDTHGLPHKFDTAKKSSTIYGIAALDRYSGGMVIETGNGMDNLTADNKQYQICFSTACHSGAFDGDNYIPAEHCIARAFTSLYADNGGPVMIAHTRAGYQEYSHNFRRTMFDYMYRVIDDPDFAEFGRHGLGVALAVAKAASANKKLAHSTTCFGDPSLNIWLNLPKKLYCNINYDDEKITIYDSNLHPVAGVAVDLIVNGNVIPHRTCADGSIYSVKYLTPSIEIFFHKEGYISGSKKAITEDTEIDGSKSCLYGSLAITNNSTVTISNKLDIPPYAEIYVEEGSTLVIEDNTIVKGATKSAANIIMGSRIVVDGDLVIGNGVKFTSDDNHEWDGVILTNKQGAKSYYLTNLDFNNCDLRSEDLCLHIHNSRFVNSELRVLWATDLNVHNCYFENSSSNGIETTSVGSVIISNSQFINCKYRGVELKNSGNILNSSIENCLFEGCKTGIKLFQSQAVIKDCEIADNSRYGVYIQGVSVAKLRKEDQDYNNPVVNNVISNNSEAQISFEKNSQLFLRYGFNKIFDNVNADSKYLRCASYSGMGKIDCGNNMWDEVNPYKFPAQDNFTPSAFYPFSNDGYLIDPLWDKVSYNPEVDKKIKLAIQEYAEKDTVSAVNILKSLVSDYPETIYADISLKMLFGADNKINDLKRYYTSLNPVNDEQELLKNYLIAQCDAVEKQYPKAIEKYEAVVENPPTLADSVYSVIEAGNLYLAMAEESKGRSGYRGKRTDLIPESREELEEKINELDKLLNPELARTGTNIFIPEKTRLHKAYPNPFNPTTTIKFALAKKQNVKIAVYDVRGREIAVLANGKMEAGVNLKKFNASELASGIYFVRMITDFKNCYTQKLTLIK